MFDKDEMRAKHEASLEAARAAWQADQTNPQALHDLARVLGTAPAFALGRAACREAWAEAAELLALGLDRFPEHRRHWAAGLGTLAAKTVDSKDERDQALHHRVRQIASAKP